MPTCKHHRPTKTQSRKLTVAVANVLLLCSNTIVLHRYILASIIANGERVVVEFSEREVEHLSYQIDNQCSFDSVLFHQIGHEPDPLQVVGPFESRKFTWTDPSAPHKVVVRLQRHWWTFGSPTSGEESAAVDVSAADGASTDGTSGSRPPSASVQGVIDPKWKPVQDALAMPHADNFVHTREVVIDLKDMSWKVPGTGVKFPLGGPGQGGRVIQFARHMEGPVVVLIVTDLPFLMDAGKPLIQSELKQAMRQRRLKMSTITKDLNDELKLINRGHEYVQTLSTSHVSSSSDQPEEWLWLDIAALRNNSTWVDTEIQPGLTHHLDKFKCKVRFPTTTEGHVFCRSPRVASGPMLKLFGDSSRSKRGRGVFGESFVAEGAGELKYNHDWSEIFSTKHHNEENQWFFHLFTKLPTATNGTAADNDNGDQSLSTDEIELMLFQGSKVIGTRILSIDELVGANADVPGLPNSTDTWVNLLPTSLDDSDQHCASKWSVRLRLSKCTNLVKSVLSLQAARLSATEAFLRSRVKMLETEIESGHLGVRTDSDINNNSEDGEGHTNEVADSGDDVGTTTDETLVDLNAPAISKAAASAAEAAEEAVGVGTVQRELSVVISNASEMLLPSEVSLDSSISAYVAVRAYNSAGQYIPTATVRTEALPLTIDPLPPRESYASGGGSKDDSHKWRIIIDSDEPLGVFLAPLPSKIGDGTIKGLLVTGKEQTASCHPQLEKLSAGCVITTVRGLDLDGLSFDEALAHVRF